MSNANRIKNENAKPEKVITFSMDEVRKTIKLYTQQLQSQINIQNNSDNENFIKDNDINANIKTENIENNKEQQKLNLFIALDKAEIKPYKEKPFIAQIFVPTKEKKDAIDSVRRELTQFIIQKTHYPYMKLEIFTLEKNTNKFIPYSPVDKFNFIAQSSPAITLLKENFKCEIKY